MEAAVHENPFSMSKSSVENPAAGFSHRPQLNKSEILRAEPKDQSAHSESLLKYPFGTDITPMKAQIIQRDYPSDQKKEDPLRVKSIRTRAENVLRPVVDDRGESSEKQRIPDADRRRRLDRVLEKEFDEGEMMERARSSGKHAMPKNQNDFGIYSRRMEWMKKIEKKGFDYSLDESEERKSRSLREVLQKRVLAKNNKVNSA